MRISHRQIDVAARNPVSWIQARNAASFTPPRGYDGYLMYGIVRLHKTGDLVDAEKHLAVLFTRAAHRLKNEERIDNAFDHLRAYHRWLKQSGLVFVQCNVRIALPFEPNHVMSGEVSRVDIAQEGYQAVILGRPSDGWENELRFPLIQVAISRLFQVPASETKVGVQCLDGGCLALRCYDEIERRDAFQKLSKLGKSLAGR